MTGGIPNGIGVLRSYIHGWPEATAALNELVAELERAKQEIAFTHDRGDHLVYRHEWEAFDAWQRSQR